MSDQEAETNASIDQSIAEEVDETVEAPQPEEPEEETQQPEEQEKDDEDDEEEYREDADDQPEEDTEEPSSKAEIIDDSEIHKLKKHKRSNAAVPVAQPTTQDQPSDHEEGEHQQPEQRNDESAKRRQELEAKLERALKRPKIKRRKDEHDLTNDDDELIQILKQQMDAAAKKDNELIESGEGIAINKIQLLPKVRSILSKANLAEVILDNNLLAEVRQWLEPLPDASLPSYEIQKTLFTALVALPINTNHLRESGIGKILLFYQKSKRVEPKIKRVADKLISDWTRPIIGASDNYRDKKFQTAEFDAMKLKQKRMKSANTDSSPKKKKEEEKSIYEQQAARRNRAARPAPAVTDYKFAPKSRVDKNAMSIASAGVGSSLNRDDQFKRIKQKLSGHKRSGGAKKGGISIEGRGL